MTTPSRTLTAFIWGGYVIFVVYGSLVPLDFTFISLGQAWNIFKHIPMHNLGVESRADWIANGVLYVPIGFLSAHLLTQILVFVPKKTGFFLSALFSVALAFGVEFVQIYFPPRSVSLNDLLAESIGSFLGLLLAARYSEWFRTLLHSAFSDPRRLTLRLVEGYLVGYVAFSLFPFDVLLSAAEINQKLQGGGWGWLLANDSQGIFIVGLKALSEIILTVPFGLFLGYRSTRKIATFKQAILLGGGLGCFIEIAQLFTATGVSQGLSVATRIIGFCFGLELWKRRSNWSPERVSGILRRYKYILGFIYLLLLLKTNGWMSRNWNGIDYAVSRYPDLHFLPFYYHYFTTEAKALFSLTSIFLMYMPIGFLVWANGNSTRLAIFAALCVSTVLETGKLFLQGMHPDPTNVLLGAVATWGAVRLATSFAEASTMPIQRELNVSEKTNSTESKQEIESIYKPGRSSKFGIIYFGVTLLLGGVAYRAITFPAQSALLLFILTAGGVVVWYRPVRLFAILLATLPILDLAPWSGRFYLDEFDLLAVVVFAIGYARTWPAEGKCIQKDTVFGLVISMFALSLTIATIRGLLPWEAIDANSFTNYFSTFNALHIAKGALWAFLGCGLLRRFWAAGVDIMPQLVLGMVFGLVMTVLVIFWERLTFVGLFDFGSDYRVTGPFSSMHLGGAYIECFLVVATPFLLIFLVKEKGWGKWLAGASLLLATTYALMVTFSRNGYLAYAVAIAITLFFVVFKSGLQKINISILALIAGALAVVVPILSGGFAQNRIAGTGTDYAVRQAHWEDTLNIRTPDLPTTFLGMGLGSYPRSHYLLSREQSHSGTYKLNIENGNTFLRLGGGAPIYVDQVVSIQPRQSYLLKLKLRAGQADEKMHVSLCEKWLLTSVKCIQIPLEQGGSAGTWVSLVVPFSTGSLSDNPWYARRPTKLTLHNPNGNTYHDIDDIRLETPLGENLLSNGDFSNELDNWFFSADHHLQWHAKSMPVAIIFDQGWFGLITICLFSMLAIKRAICGALRNDNMAVVALASFSGFMIVGLFDTLIDAPRFLFLFVMLGGLCSLKSPGDQNRHQSV